MPEVQRKTGRVEFEVLVSFSGLNMGDRFWQDADDMGWALLYVETGYLRVVSEEDPNVGSEVGQG